MALSVELDPDIADVVDALLALGVEALRLTLTSGRWLDDAGREWVAEEGYWHPSQHAA